MPISPLTRPYSRQRSTSARAMAVDSSADHRKPLFSLAAILAALLIFFLLAPIPAAHAQSETPYDMPDTPANSLRIPGAQLAPSGDADQGTLEEAGAEDDETDVQASRGRRSQKLIIDTDPGVDDWLALAWLLTQDRYRVEPLGIVTVAGNTSEPNASANVLLLLDLLGLEEIPVVRGAAAPSSTPLNRTGALLHGPDGLWFSGGAYQFDEQGNPLYDVSGLPANATDFYCTTAAENPGATLLALGPLTNVAAAFAQCADAMATLDIVVLGGAKFGGNATPTTEANFRQDAAATATVFTSGAIINLVPLDAFNQLSFSLRDTVALATKGTPVAQYLAPALGAYICSQQESIDCSPESTPKASAPVPDAVAALYAVDRRVGESNSGLVKIITTPDLVRGQSVIGLDLNERISMIADDETLGQLADAVFSDPNFDLFAALGAILFSEPDNAMVTLDVNERRIRRLLAKELLDTRRTLDRDDDDAKASASALHAPELNQNLFLPNVTTP